MNLISIFHIWDYGPVNNGLDWIWIMISSILGSTDYDKRKVDRILIDLPVFAYPESTVFKTNFLTTYHCSNKTVKCEDRTSECNYRGF